MTWDVICHVLQPFGMVQAVKGNFEQADALLLMSGDAADMPNIVYVSAEPALPRPFHHALVVSLQGGITESDNVICLERGALAQVFNVLAAAKNWLDGLGSALALCSSDQEILDRASLHMGVPMFYLDESYRILAMTKSLDFPGDEEWVHMKEKGYLSPGNAQRMKDSGDLDLLATAHTPMVYHSEIYPFPSITSNVWLGGVFVSRLTVLCIDGNTSPLTIRACELITAHLRRIVEGSDRHSDRGPLQSMLVELLHGVRLSEELIEDRLRSAPHLQSGVKQVFFADVKARDDRQLAPYYASLLQRLYPEEPFMPLVWQEQLVLLAYAREEGGFDPLTVKLAHFFAQHHLRCGVSNPFRHIRDLRGYCHQAMAALQREEQTGLSFYRSIMLEQMLSHIPAEETRFLISPDILRLEEAEARYSFSLVETLQMYLECNCNLNRTAERLYLHKNTLLYRLNHIRSILRCDLGDADERLLLMLSFKLRQRSRQ
ncbi:MAG: helix-turn-helix domain-containing protein [Oscillospiraceae bacterium]|nr:helix-turn-helix domain-containing protein [Oscillospiraceae bacterium]